MWSYMPSHWKGVLSMAAIIGVVVPLGLIANRYNQSLVHSAAFGMGNVDVAVLTAFAVAPLVRFHLISH